MRHGLNAGCAALFLWASTWFAVAQTLPVRTGEHEGFTRLVIQIGPDRQWDLQDRDGGFRLRVVPNVDGFDLSTSFDLIPRDRIADLGSVDGELSGALACACDVTAFRYLDRFLVIDVADARPDPAPDPDPAPTPGADAAARQLEAARQRQRTAAAAALPDLARVLTGGPSILSRQEADGITPPAPAPPENDPTPTLESRSELEQATRIMAEQLARAAAAGLLRPSADTSVAFADPIAAPDGPEVDSAPRPDAPPDIAPDTAADTGTTEAPDVASFMPGLSTPSILPSPGQGADRPASADLSGSPSRTAPELPLRARTALDPVPTYATGSSGSTTPLLACTGAAMRIRDWSVSEDFASGLGELRLDLFDERDQLVQEEALRLVRHYLSHGFGVEAQFWLSRMAAVPDELIALAALLEGRAASPYTDVMDTTACSDEEVLLRLLGGAIDPPLSETDVDRVQRGFSHLPDALQDRFGPELVRSLASGGHTAAARNIRDALHRSARLSAGSLIALDLEIGIDMDAGDARRRLDVALRDDGATPAPAMAQVLALDRAEGRATTVERVTAAAGLLRETPGGPDADALWRELVAAQARLGRIDVAIAMLDDGRMTHPAVWQQTVTEVLADRLEVEDTATLLLMAHLFGADWADGGSRAGRVRVAAARRLQEASLGEAAAMILTNGPGLMLPRSELPASPDAGRAALWAEGDWTAIARAVDGPHSELARRMARVSAEPQAARALQDGIDLDVLAAQVADSGALRRTVNAVLTSRLSAEGQE